MKIISVVPTFNRRKELHDLLTMLQVMEKPVGVQFECICVVNGLNDGTPEMVHSKFPEVHLIRGSANWWYTKSMNEGFKQAKELNPDLILTLNDDIILPKNYISNLVEAYRKMNHVCIVGSTSFTHNKPHRIINSGVQDWNRYLDKTTSYLPFLSIVDPSSVTGIYTTPVLPGRGTLIPWTVLQKLSFFDETFAQYHSDLDFTLRALKNGIPVYISWDAQVFTYLEKTNSGSSFLHSSLETLIKNFKNPYSRIYILDKARYYWRHGFKYLWPWYMVKFIILSFKNHYFKFKIA